MQILALPLVAAGTNRRWCRNAIIRVSEFNQPIMNICTDAGVDADSFFREGAESLGVFTAISASFGSGTTSCCLEWDTDVCCIEAQKRSLRYDLTIWWRQQDRLRVSKTWRKTPSLQYRRATCVRASLALRWAAAALGSLCCCLHLRRDHNLANGLGFLLHSADK